MMKFVKKSPRKDSSEERNKEKWKKEHHLKKKKDKNSEREWIQWIAIDVPEINGTPFSNQFQKRKIFVAFFFVFVPQKHTIEHRA